MKNLSQHKDKVNARELLVQALYEYSFGQKNIHTGLELKVLEHLLYLYAD